MSEREKRKRFVKFLENQYREKLRNDKELVEQYIKKGEPSKAEFRRRMTTGSGTPSTHVSKPEINFIKKKLRGGKDHAYQRGGQKCRWWQH